jgi:hypothetical protein
VQRGRRLAWTLGLVGLAFLVRSAAESVAWNGYTLDFLHFSTALDPYETPDQSIWTTRIGLHPPQYALFVRALVGLGFSVGAVLSIYAAISAAAVGAGVHTIWRRGGPIAAVAFGVIAALSPLQAYYSWQVTNYVLLSLVGLAWFGLLWNLAADHKAPVQWFLLPLGMAMTHLHVLGMALVAASLLPLLLWRRRLEAAASFVALLVAIPVILPLLDHLRSYRSSAGAAARVSPGYEGLDGLARAYLEQYGNQLSLTGVMLCSLLAVLVLLRSKQQGDRAVLIGTTAVLGLALIATFGGVTNPRQGQYWVLGSLLHAVVLGLGIGRARPALRAAMIVSLAPWLLGAGAQVANLHLQFTPAPKVEQRAEYWLVHKGDSVWLGTPEIPDDFGGEVQPLSATLLVEAQQAIATSAAASDVILYIDETWWGSDNPRRTDPFFAAFPPSATSAVLPQAQAVGAPPRTGYRYPWRFDGRPLQIVTDFPRDATAARAGELATALRARLDQGQTVLVAMVLMDPSAPPPAVEPFLEGLEVLEDTKTGPVRLLRIGPSPQKR